MPVVSRMGPEVKAGHVIVWAKVNWSIEGLWLRVDGL